jgi:hypothetical protein
MFSDFKSRGFAITDTHVTKVDRLERLILILTIALYWAVSIGMTPAAPEEKKYSSKKVYRSMCSSFKQGLRIITNSLFYLSFSHTLWMFL